MIIRGIHYGLTLLYSYLLPVFSIKENQCGFTFTVSWGSLKGVKCVFNEETLETRCETHSQSTETSLYRLLGLEKKPLFSELCRFLSLEKCISQEISLIYEPSYKRPVAYSVMMSGNTDYYVNTVKWVKDALEKGYVDSSSYIPRWFNTVKHHVDTILSTEMSPLEEAVSLMSIHGFGVKYAKAYLLHAYGLTEHAPIDRHYTSLLNIQPGIDKKKCLSAGRLNCTSCSMTCPYGFSTRVFRQLNGVVQSLIYIYGRLRLKRKTRLEEILVVNSDYYLDLLEPLIERIIDVVSRYKE